MVEKYFSSEQCLKQSDPCSWKSSFNSSTFSITIFSSSIPSSSSTFLESIFFSASLSKYFSTIFKSFSFKTCLNPKNLLFPNHHHPLLHLPPFLLHLFLLLLL